MTPPAIGMVETLERKCKVERKFEGSNENMIRLIAVYYSSGIMGGDNYRSVYKASLYRQV